MKGLDLFVQTKTRTIRKLLNVSSIKVLKSHLQMIDAIDLPVSHVAEESGQTWISASGLANMRPSNIDPRIHSGLDRTIPVHLVRRISNSHHARQRGRRLWAASEMDCRGLRQSRRTIGDCSSTRKRPERRQRQQGGKQWRWQWQRVGFAQECGPGRWHLLPRRHNDRFVMGQL